MTRLLLTEVPGAARPAKNTAAPGLPNHTRNASKGRAPMVDTDATEPAGTDETLTFTPAELNALISRVCAETLAARLSARAAWYRQQADQGEGSADELTRTLAAFLTVEADMLDTAAARELAVLAPDRPESEPGEVAV